MNMNFSLAFRFKKADGEYVIVPQYVSECFTKYETAFGNYSFQSLTWQRDQFGWSIESAVSNHCGESVKYAGEFGGIIKTEGMQVLGMFD
jgi:hypothetical protein